LLGSGNLIAWTSATAIGTMIAVRTVIDGTPSVNANPIRKNANEMPA